MVFLQFVDDGKNNRQSPVVVEVPVNLKAGWCNLFGKTGLLNDIVQCAGVHLKDGIALGSGT